MAARRKSKISIPGTDVIVEKTTITPKEAAAWLECNTHNRRISQPHVDRLAHAMEAGQWQFNGESIKIADTERVLDGQHRLLACIESGHAFDTMVVYGLKEEAFQTIDTGLNRKGKDVLALHYPDAGAALCKCAATAVGYIRKLREGVNTKAARGAPSNTETLVFMQDNPGLWHVSHTVLDMPKDQRLLPVALVAGVYFEAGRKHQHKADEFFRLFLTGVMEQNTVVHRLRTVLINDLGKRTRFSTITKLMILVNAWNHYRKGTVPARASGLIPRSNVTDVKVR